MPANLQHDAEPADPVFICIMQQARVLHRGGYVAHERLRWDALIDHCTQPPAEPTLKGMIGYCFANRARLNPAAADFIQNMMDCARRDRRISEKQQRRTFPDKKLLPGTGLSKTSPLICDKTLLFETHDIIYT